jgi:hypothetical protein
MDREKILYQEIGQQRTNNLVLHYKVRDLGNKIIRVREENLNYMGVMLANNHNISANNYCMQHMISEHNELLQRYNNLEITSRKIIERNLNK